MPSSAVSEPGTGFIIGEVIPGMLGQIHGLAVAAHAFVREHDVQSFAVDGDGGHAATVGIFVAAVAVVGDGFTHHDWRVGVSFGNCFGRRKGSLP